MGNKTKFDFSPDDLLNKDNLEEVKQAISKRLKIRRDTREKKHQQELFDPSKPTKGKTK